MSYVSGEQNSGDEDKVANSSSEEEPNVQAPVIMSTFGRADEFDSKKESWLQYKERLEAFFAANEVTDPKRKLNIFISTVGSSTYARLRAALLPKKPSDSTFAEVLEVLDRSLDPKPSAISESFRFHHRNQQVGESVGDYLSELRKIVRIAVYVAAIARAQG